MPVAPHLGKELEAFLDTLVKSGGYVSREEALRKGFKMMRAHEKQRKALSTALAAGKINPKIKQVAMREFRLKSRREELLQAMKAYRRPTKG